MGIYLNQVWRQSDADFGYGGEHLQKYYLAIPLTLCMLSQLDQAEVTTLDYTTLHSTLLSRLDSTRLDSARLGSTRLYLSRLDSTLCTLRLRALDFCWLDLT
jgi:hypothetical protein